MIGNVTRESPRAGEFKESLNESDRRRRDLSLSIDGKRYTRGIGVDDDDDANGRRRNLNRVRCGKPQKYEFQIDPLVLLD